MIKLEKRVDQNTHDIKSLRHDVNDNTKRITVLEVFIVPELKSISSKIDNIKMPWLQYVGILAIGSFLTIAAIMIMFGGQV